MASQAGVGGASGGPGSSAVGGLTDQSATAAAHVRQWCAQSDLDWEESPERTFVIVLPGEQKLRTTVSVHVGEFSTSMNAFVMRHPDENTEAVHRWLLQRNLRIFGLAYAIDHLGDIFLVGRWPHHAVTVDTLDTVMGSVLDNADAVFNQLLEMGFASSIRKEWRWRLAAGESTRNLEAFRHLAEDHPD